MGCLQLSSKLLILLIRFLLPSITLLLPLLMLFTTKLMSAEVPNVIFFSIILYSFIVFLLYESPFTGLSLFLRAKLGGFCAIYVHFLSSYVKSEWLLSSINIKSSLQPLADSSTYHIQALCDTTNWKKK